jgi:geranylgeranyl pyrophosphate synthase
LILSLKGVKFSPEENLSLFKPFSPKLDVFDLVRQEMHDFSKSIENSLESSDNSLNFISQYYFKNPGKNIRPTIALVLAKAINDQGNIFDSKILPEQMIFSQVIEMIHCSSLIHDDVIDNGLTRRGQESIHTKVGKKFAVIGGDYLIATASLLCTTIGDMRLMKLISSIFENLTRGELIQSDSSLSNLDDLLVEYCHKTYFKTASLISHTCRGIGMYGKEEEKCFEFGKHLGLAFQYIDDVLDFVGTSKTLGKPALNDLKSGVVTGPVLFAAYFQKELGEMMERDFSEDGDLAFAQQAAIEFGVEATRRLALNHLKLAVDAIGFVNQGSAFDALVSLAGKVYARKS